MLIYQRVIVSKATDKRVNGESPLRKRSTKYTHETWITWINSVLFLLGSVTRDRCQYPDLYVYIEGLYKAYVREHLHKIWPYMVQYLHFRILKFPLIYIYIYIIPSRPQVSATVRCHATHSMASRGSPSVSYLCPGHINSLFFALLKKLYIPLHGHMEWNHWYPTPDRPKFKLFLINSKRNTPRFNIFCLIMCLFFCRVCLFSFCVIVILSCFF